MSSQATSEGRATLPAVPSKDPGGAVEANPGVRRATEDAGRSLAAMAQRDLDAALQLLAERAEYITQASGAAIALRRGDHNDMLCRASTGSNAPELGSVLSMEYGLSGECVRTRQPLRCDDAERDPRVNHEVCRQLGIASVVLMPIVSNEQVLGVFELFSGKPRAFEPRDVSALQRLSEMAGTAVRQAVAVLAAPIEEAEVPDTTAAEAIPAKEAAAVEPLETEIAASPAFAESASKEITGKPAQEVEEKAPSLIEKPMPEPNDPEPQPVAPAKPLFWSAALQGDGETATAAETAVPAVLRNLKKCQACGFPVSQGRTLCVECEEKKWRGQPVAKPAAPAEKKISAAPRASEPEKKEPAVVAASPEPSVEKPARTESPDPVSGALPESKLFLSAAQPSESWLAANKYVFGALLLVVIAVLAFLFLR
ncbi:MAG TPA: GAF domain-containing protein [Candidatus Binatia bacterium]|nr:GAF domain-containing protein [Candidatus Binatia bacterium]